MKNLTCLSEHQIRVNEYVLYKFKNYRCIYLSVKIELYVFYDMDFTSVYNLRLVI